MDTDYEKFSQTAEFLKILAHPVRLCMIKGLLEKGECNVTHMQQCIHAPQSTVSQHLQKLRAAHMIEARREGLEVYYRIAEDHLEVVTMICSLVGQI